MNDLEFNVNGKVIRLYGNKSIIENEKTIIERLHLTGNEFEDRLTIQNAIDEYKLKSNILYDGNTVYPFEKIVKEYRRLQKTGSLENLTKELYEFFMYACGDIAHYNLSGYKTYYDYSFRKLEEEFLKNCWTSSRFTDIDKILKELKIGKQYYKERELIDIDKVTINRLKLIFKECGWKINTNSSGYLELSKDVGRNITYTFNLDILNRTVSRIVKDINYISNSFNKESYIEDILSKRNITDNTLTISEIVASANNIKVALNQLLSDLIYKVKITAEDKSFSKESENINYEY